MCTEIKQRYLCKQIEGSETLFWKEHGDQRTIKHFLTPNLWQIKDNWESQPNYWHTQKAPSVLVYKGAWGMSTCFPQLRAAHGGKSPEKHSCCALSFSNCIS